MVVSEDKAEVARIALDDIAAIIASAHGLTYSNNLLVALAERNAPLIICSPNFTPSAYLWPVSGNHRQAARMDAQVASSVPMGKRLWKTIVQAKIAQQAGVLASLGVSVTVLTALIPKVRSGDPDNVEAMAAKRYWPLAFGTDFRRDRSLPGPNAMLNYGYMVLRAAMARAIMGAGLHPSLGIHHRNEVNPMRLADDLMEPFRPFTDRTVLSLRQMGETEINSDVKKTLAAVAYADVPTQRGTTPVMGAMIALATSLAQNYEGERTDLDLPDAPKFNGASSQITLPMVD